MPGLESQVRGSNPELSSGALIACRMTDIQTTGRKGEVGGSHVRPGDSQKELVV